MAHPTPRLIAALRHTAVRLTDASVTYRWSSFAHCNCGHLAQTITHKSPQEIQDRAMQQEGDWGAQAKELPAPLASVAPDYGDRPALDEGAWEPENVGACTATGIRLDSILRAMFRIGLEPDDVAHLERLSDPAVRRRLGNNTEHFAHHQRTNVIAYLCAWADLLEAELEAGASESSANFSAAAE